MTAVSDFELAHAYETVNYYRRGGAAKLELNRPDRLNAWNDQLSIDLLAALNAAAGDPSVRALLITGAGRAFSSGADLGDRLSGQSGPPDVYSRLTERYHPVIVGVREMPKPVVSAVTGAAAGIGLSLALACDLVVAAESAYFLQAFANVGLTLDGGASALLVGRIGHTRASQMALLAQKLTAAQALDWGLVNRVVADDQLLSVTRELAAGLADGPPGSYAAMKQTLNAAAYPNLAELMDMEAVLQQERADSKDFIEGVTAFLEKRPAQFTGN